MSSTSLVSQSQALAVWGDPTQGSLTRREDLLTYGAAIRWDGDRPWRNTSIDLPTGKTVQIDHFVAENFQRPRVFHPEYALALEILVHNAVTEAKARGFDIVSVELGYWAYKTLVHMGKRVTKIGLPSPITREDGRTKTRKAYQWVTPGGQGILLLPWAAGDQQVRFRDERGIYVVPVTEATADASKCQQRLSWKGVKDYPQLPYETQHPWESVPLLEAGDDMTLLLDCEGFCKEMMPMNGTVWRSDATWTFVYRTTDANGKTAEVDLVLPGTRKRWCRRCHDELKRLRLNAANQGWNYDSKTPLKLPSGEAVKPAECDHHWGMQMQGSRNVLLPSGEIEHNSTARFVCIKCDEPTPDEHLTPKLREMKLAQEMRLFKKRKRH